MSSGKVFHPLKAIYENMTKEYPTFTVPQDRHTNGEWSGSIQGTPVAVGEDDDPPMESITGRWVSTVIDGILLVL